MEEGIGWTTKRTGYCQMICDVKKEKRLKFAQENREMPFDDIYTDETTANQTHTTRFHICTHRR